MLKHKTKVIITFPFCITAAIFLYGNLREEYLCALIISLMHEAGHLIAMCMCSVYPDSVVFTPTGIRIDCPKKTVSCRHECIISASGPVVNLVLMPILYFIELPMPFYINAGLLFINMIPLKSLDAGRFLFNFLIIKKDEFFAVKIMNIIETAVCVCIVLFLIITLINGNYNPSFIMLTVMLVVTTVIQLRK